ncbi:diacylglycerol/lipid kinase family protein [Microbacterium halophytorum]|uniref:diacylglycerol/lipid kinase family protein n=1 Tax=Microbacterium halophytorum TaxID=2067568 RepID=UPI000CFAB9B1|nr:diacylglycerol kinase family protein [Microbacterium halophytorum]
MAQQVAIVWNPSKTSREELEDALGDAVEKTGAELEVMWLQTSPDDPGRAAAEQAIDKAAGLIVAAGGDGTVRAVAEVLAERTAALDVGAPGAASASVPRDGLPDLAIAPLGTGNLLARNLGVPVGDLAAAFTRALADDARSIDVGWLSVDGADERQAFAVMAGFGIDAHMISETDDDLKSRVGWLAYVESLGRAVSVSEVIDIRVTEGDGAEREARAHTLMIGNCGMVQGGITLLPAADPADGELDMLVVDTEGVGGWFDAARNMLWDNGLKKLLPGTGVEAESSDSIAHHRTTRIRIDLDEPREIELDGDIIGEATRIDAEVQPAALRVR